MCSAFSSLLSQTTIPVETQHNALVLQTDNGNRLRNVYFGRRLAAAADYAAIPREYRRPEEENDYAYTPGGSRSLVEPAIQVVQADGNTSLDLKYISNTIQKIDDNVKLTTVVLKDDVYPVEVKLLYKTYAKEDVVEQWAEIKNNGSKALIMDKYASANLYLRSKKYYLKHYNGDWAQEMHPEEEELTHGIKSIDSKLGSRADLFEPPSFMVSIDKPAGEDDGKVILANLAWTGNYKIDFEVDAYNNLRLIAGINPYASEYQLQAGASFTTPALIYTYSETGKGDASRNLHHWATKYRIVDGEGQRLTLLNNWEATYFNFDENKLTGLFKGAKELGVDMFLLDDGWFANKYPRNSDHTALGDWQENTKKLPHGLGYLVKQAEATGIKFGIWVEPEMVSPKSELYENHKDWVIRQPQREEKYFRNQLVLDLTNPEVQDFVFGVLDTLFTKNSTLAFIKWDCNAVMYNVNSAYLQKQGLPQTQLYVDYVKGLYKVLDRLRAKYPKVPMMLCSGGGARVDYGGLKYFTEYWPSDNTDPLERIFIQWEDSYFFPAIASCNHITDWGKQPLKFRTDVAMMGKLGYDIVVDKLTQDELAFSKQAVSSYKSLSDVIWHGDMYHLQSPWDNNAASAMFVNMQKTRAVMFSYLVNNRYLPVATPLPIKLKGLDAKKKYSVKEINLFPGTRSNIDGKREYSGDFLMTVGINPNINSSRSSVVLEVNEVK